MPRRERFGTRRANNHDVCTAAIASEREFEQWLMAALAAQRLALAAQAASAKAFGGRRVRPTSAIPLKSAGAARAERCSL